MNINNNSNTTGQIFNKKLKEFHELSERRGNLAIYHEVKNFLPKERLIYIASLITQRYEKIFLELNVEQLMNIQPNNFQPLMLVIKEKDDDRRIENDIVKIPLTLSMRIQNTPRIYLIKIKNIISSFVFNYEDILRKLEKSINGLIDTKKCEVTVEPLGLYNENITLPLNINSNENKYSHLLVFTLKKEAQEEIIALSEIIKPLGEKQFIRNSENSYINKLIIKKGLFRFMYYMDVILNNINEFNETLRYGIQIIRCEDKHIVFDESNYKIDASTEAGNRKVRLSCLRKLVEIFIENFSVQQNQEVNDLIINALIQQIQQIQQIQANNHLNINALNQPHEINLLNNNEPFRYQEINPLFNYLNNNDPIHIKG